MVSVNRIMKTAEEWVIEFVPDRQMVTLDFHQLVHFAQQVQLDARPAAIERDKLRAVVEWIAAQENLFFAECSQAEEIVSRCREALKQSKNG